MEAEGQGGGGGARFEEAGGADTKMGRRSGYQGNGSMRSVAGLEQAPTRGRTPGHRAAHIADIRTETSLCTDARSKRAHRARWGRREVHAHSGKAGATEAASIASAPAPAHSRNRSEPPPSRPHRPPKSKKPLPPEPRQLANNDDEDYIDPERGDQDNYIEPTEKLLPRENSSPLMSKPLPQLPCDP
ncbi:hypothetical protein CRUP_009930, partial [Coryphaenoides rupestris]